MTALRQELRRGPGSIVVLEDLNWADEVTLGEDGRHRRDPAPQHSPSRTRAPSVSAAIASSSPASQRASARAAATNARRCSSPVGRARVEGLVERRPRLGVTAPCPQLELAGDWKAAERAWSAIGCPYEAALALAVADDEQALQRSVNALRALGARPAAARVARALRERGVRDVPKGPRAATRSNRPG